MNLHLIEISRHIATNADAIILVDQAGWHITGKLELPSNISLVPLPSKCPEINALLSEVEGPVENIWEYLRDNWLSNRIFKSYEDIVDHCCSAWNNLSRKQVASDQSDTVNGRISIVTESWYKPPAG